MWMCLKVCTQLREEHCFHFAGKSRKTCRSSRSPAGLQSPDYPTLPLTLSTEALQNNQKSQRTKVSRGFLLKPSLKGFSLRGLRKAHRGLSIPVSRSCEDLDGPPQSTRTGKRSHSLGDLRWEPSGEQRDLGVEHQLSKPKLGQSSPTKTGKLELPSAQNGAASPQGRGPRPAVPSQLPLLYAGRAQSSKPPEPLSSPTPSPPESTGSGEKVVRTHPKKPPVPPPVPAKKSKERLANGLRHPPLSLPSSPSPTPSPTHSFTRSHPGSPVVRSPSPSAPALPAKSPSTPASPGAASPVPAAGEDSAPATPPPWLSDLGGKVSFSRKTSHSKMSLDLLTLVEQRLEAEGIDLTEEPYSDKVSRSSFMEIPDAHTHTHTHT